MTLSRRPMYARRTSSHAKRVRHVAVLVVGVAGARPELEHVALLDAVAEGLEHAGVQRHHEMKRQTG